jgi:hypothetical protein
MRTPSVEIQFGGRMRRLIYDFNALAELQDRAGTYVSTIATLKAVRDALWAGLLAETLDSRGRETKDTLSISEVSAILDQMVQEDPGALESIAAKIQEARGKSEAPKDDHPTEATGPSQSAV